MVAQAYDPTTREVKTQGTSLLHNEVILGCVRPYLTNKQNPGRWRTPTPSAFCFRFFVGWMCAPAWADHPLDSVHHLNAYLWLVAHTLHPTLGRQMEAGGS